MIPSFPTKGQPVFGIGSNWKISLTIFLSTLLEDFIKSFFSVSKNTSAFTEEHIEGDGQEENNHEVLLKCLFGEAGEGGKLMDHHKASMISQTFERDSPWLGLDMFFVFNSANEN